MSISIDAQILIWGIKRQATPNRQEMIERAADFFRQCSEDRQQVYLPAQSFAEFLVGYDADRRRQLIALLPRGSASAFRIGSRVSPLPAFFYIQESI